MHFRVKDSVALVPFPGGKTQIWTCAIQTKGGISPRSVQRYTWKACDRVRNTVDGSKLLVRDEVLKRMALDIGPSLVK
jgi:hypothetical protein